MKSVNIQDRKSFPTRNRWKLEMNTFNFHLLILLIFLPFKAVVGSHHRFKVWGTPIPAPLLRCCVTSSKSLKHYEVPLSHPHCWPSKALTCCYEVKWKSIQGDSVNWGIIPMSTDVAQIYKISHKVTNWRI